MKGLITNIQRFSIHDGPGIRTTIFFKGCPLNCIWCSNPENINPVMQVMQTKSMCLQCDKCISGCMQKALYKSDGYIVSDAKICNLCGICEKNCPLSNIQIIGRYYKVNKLLNEILRDKVFFNRTSGGVTYSGGEPTIYLDFLLELSKKLKAENINIAIETCGYFDFNMFKKLIPFLDLIYFDLKVMDSSSHEKNTGKDNKIILENLKMLVNYNKEIIIRFPFIPGYTDDKKNIKEIINIMRVHNLKRIDVLPYHRLGEKKYLKLGMDYKLKDTLPSNAIRKVKEIKNIFEDSSIEVLIGG